LLIINIKINDLNKESTQRHTTKTIISTSQEKWLQPFALFTMTHPNITEEINQQNAQDSSCLKRISKRHMILKRSWKSSTLPLFIPLVNLPQYIPHKIQKREMLTHPTHIIESKEKISISSVVVV